jgi:hypothetical protein
LSFDLDAAYSIVDRCIRQEVVDAIADVVGDCDRTPRLVFPHPSFDDDDAVDAEASLDPVPRNALPFAYAHYLREILGCDVDEEIVQAARAGRTKLGNWLRFLCQPTFVGVVERRPYILLDDVVSTCGTMTALRSHIVRNGGTVPLVSALASSDGSGMKFGIAPETMNMLRSAYGRELGAYWSEAIGHEVSCLSEAEGRFLLQEADRWRRTDLPDQTSFTPTQRSP